MSAPDLLTKTQQGVKLSRQGWFSKIARLLDRGSVAAQTWEELEELLILADVGVATAEKLLQRVKEQVKKERLEESTAVREMLQREMVAMLAVEPPQRPSDNPPLQVLLVVGVNGSGKTTSIAKLAYQFKNEGKKVVLAAADTFRAAAIDQLKVWGKRVGAEVIAHQPGGDPGAVVFDAIEAARSRNARVVIVDTAGRLHTKFNLMEELKKIKRIIARSDASYTVLLVLDATTGQNGLAQARHFTEAVNVDGIFLTKLDGTSKGGIVLAICDELKIPILYIGTGEQLDDIAPFDATTFVEAIFSGRED
jgi:fused signal recognition particle receptor